MRAEIEEENVKETRAVIILVRLFPLEESDEDVVK